METQTVFFIGKPGCGKGTQAKLLAERTGWKVFASGKLFRQIAAENTPVGRKVKAENDAGILQPHWFAMYLYLRELFSVQDGEGAIFDGFNRKVLEAELVIDSMEWLGKPLKVFDIQVSDEEVARRLDIRKEVEGRVDDSVVSKRIEEYYVHTEPALALFRKHGVVVEINGEQLPAQVAEDVRAALSI
jgi:adenylate kinase